MDNQLLSFLRSLDNVILDKPNESELQKIKELSSNRLPAVFLEAYSTAVPSDDIEFEDFVFYGLERMIEENTDYIPGANLLPLGFFTFASTFDGDCICFDMNDSNYPVYQCSHSLHSGEDDISYSKNSKFVEMIFNYENVKATVPMLAKDFEEFISLLQSGSATTFSVTDMIARL